jgi:uncharacterized protein YdhG (YjbR/CyaY superfamily)
MDKDKIFKTTDEYIDSLKEPHRNMMKTLRNAIKVAAPEAVEVISYNMPAFKVNGRILVYFAAHTNHIGFYPTNMEAIRMFSEEIGNLNTSKGTIRFQLDKKIPTTLVKKIVKFRMEQNRVKKMKK